MNFHCLKYNRAIRKVSSSDSSEVAKSEFESVSGKSFKFSEVSN